MGSQVGIAHDDVDERAMIGWLATQGELRCWPAAIVGEIPPPLRLEDASGRRMVVFLQRDADAVLAGVYRPLGDPDDANIATPENHGISFEWSRGCRSPRGDYVLGGAEGGRIWYQKEPSPRAEELRRLVARLLRWLHRTSPWISDERYPRYVGASLGERVSSGSARLIHPKGGEVPLVPNPRFRAQRSRIC